MPIKRNKLGQFVSESNGNNITLPSFSTIFKWSFIITILYPWYVMFSNMRERLMGWLEIMFNSIPKTS